MLASEIHADAIGNRVGFDAGDRRSDQSLVDDADDFSGREPEIDAKVHPLPVGYGLAVALAEHLDRLPHQ